MFYSRISIQNYYTNLLKLPNNNPTVGQDNQFMTGEYNRQHKADRDYRNDFRYLEASRLEDAGRLKAGHLEEVGRLKADYLEQVGRLKKANRDKCMIIVAGVIGACAVVIVACALVFYMIYKI